MVTQQCLDYEFKCNLCDAGYVGYTRGHLHERVEGHTRKSSSIYWNIITSNIIVKCLNASLINENGKFDCLVKAMLYIRMRKPTLNVQTDSIRAKVFV